MMMRWWAAFFIAGIAAPPGPDTGLLMSLCAAGLAIGVSAWGSALAARSDRSVEERFARSAAVCALICATALIVWSAAGVEAGARGRLGPPARREMAVAGHGAPQLSSSYRGGGANGASETGLRSFTLDGARARLLRWLDDDRLSRRGRALVGALILDDRRGLDFAISDSYSYLGITHFLALSGMHLGAIAIPLSRILSWLIRSKRTADVMLFAILCLYAAVAGCPASLMRALFLSAAVIAYRLVGLHTDLVGALVAGSFALVAIDPAIAFDAGFQLSFAAVCGIAFIAIPVSRMMEPRLPGGYRGKALKAVLLPALITCSVQFFTMPLTISLFKRSSLLAPLVNVIVSLPFTVLLYIGAIYVFVPIAPLRAILAPAINLVCRFLGWAPAVFAKNPHEALLRGDFDTPAYVCAAALVAWSLRASCMRKRSARCAALACLAVAFIAPRCSWSGGPARYGGGVADAPAEEPLVRFHGGVYAGGGGGVVIVGSGFTSRDSYRLTRKLWGMGVRRIDRCFVGPSRLKANHGIFYLLARMPVGEVIHSPYLRDRDVASLRGALGRALAARAARRGERFSGGAWRIEITGPLYPPPRGSSLADSDAGLVGRFVLERSGRITSLDFEDASGYHAVP